MKTLIAIVGVVVTGMAIGFFATRSKHAPAMPAPESTVAEVAQHEIAEMQQPAAAPEPKPREAAAPTPEIPIAREVEAPKTAPVVHTPAELAFNHAVDTLVSPGASFAQKQGAWGQLRDSGKLDQAMSELERRASAHPQVAEYPATLGQAYLQKAGTIQDIREQGILGMKADQSFDLALELDSQNWEARFWKASALSYWPPQLGKGKEVIEHCLELVKLQESQAPKPEFAQVYVLLGEQYAREGYPDYAKEAWQRGTTVFPEHQVLTQKLAGAH